MTSVIEQQCPLCSNQSQYEFLPGSALLKHFKCTKCNEFVIHIDIENRVNEGTPQLRSMLSDKAIKANIGEIFVIVKTPPKQTRDGFIHSGVCEEYIERDKLWTLQIIQRLSGMIYSGVMSHPN
jgi:hypothetical protein